MAAVAETIRIATWNIGFERPGPGLLLQDIHRGEDPQIAAAADRLVRLDADLLILTAFDHDPALHALTALAALLGAQGLSYSHLYAPRPNSGLPTGLDLDGDGRSGGPADAQGWGAFPGAGSMAILSRLPLRSEAAQDHGTFLWRDLPGTLLPADTAPEIAAIQRLSSRSHLVLPLALPGGKSLTLLLWHATPPVFDGPEDRNGRRNHDEAAFWLHLIDGRLPGLAPPEGPFLIAGDANLDPVDGEGRPAALAALLSHPRLQDPRPAAAPRPGGPSPAPAHRGDPALDTAFYERLGGLRLDYLIPSRDLAVAAAGIQRPATRAEAMASHHDPVWIDIRLPDG